MSKLDFKALVEALLLEDLKAELMPPKSAAGVEPIPGGIEQILAKTEKYAFEQGKYEKNDTVLSFKAAWPYMDVLGAIYKSVVDNNLYKIGPEARKAIVDALNTPGVKSVEEFFTALNLPNNIKLPDNIENIVNSIQLKVDTLKRDKQNYRDYFIIRFKQLNDKTAILAAEKYLPLAPYTGISALLKEYGGYDTGIIDNILKYPGETRYTQQSNIEGPVMATIVEISKLMLIFYREYIMDQKEANGQPIVDAVVRALNLQSSEELKAVVEVSAGKLSPRGQAGKLIQQDYINFINGKSAFTIDPTVQPPVNIPMTPPKPLIEKIADFQGMTDTGQVIYQSFLQLFNNIKKGPGPAGWQVAGKKLNYLSQAFSSIASFAGAKLYGN